MKRIRTDTRVVAKHRLFLFLKSLSTPYFLCAFRLPFLAVGLKKTANQTLIKKISIKSWGQIVEYFID